MHSGARFRNAAKVHQRFCYQPRLEALEGRLPTGGMLTGLTPGLSWLLPGLPELEADATTATIALATDRPIASESPQDRWAVPDTASATSGPMVVMASSLNGEPSTVSGSGGSHTTGFPASPKGLENPLAFPLAADPLRPLTPSHDTTTSFPSVVAGPGFGTGPTTALGMGAGSRGLIITAAPGTVSSVSRSIPLIAGERLPAASPPQAAGLPLTGTTTPSPTQAARIRQQYSRMPLRFEANVGQTDPHVQFLARGPGYQLFLSGTEAVLTLQAPAGAPAPYPALGNSNAPAVMYPALGPRMVVRMQVLGANPAALGVGAQPLPSQVHYFLGNNPRQWHTHIDTYARVNYANVYPGIDLTYYGSQQQLEYDFVVAPGADPSRIHLGFAGADGLAVDAQGELEVQADAHMLRQHAPVVYQDIAGVRQPVAGRFVVEGQTVGFAVGAYDASRPLVIDPVLSYSTYLGGSGGILNSGDSGNGVAVDASGNAYLTGSTISPDFPTANALQPTKGGGPSTANAFVTKLSADGTTLVYSTYLGGSSFYGDSGSAIAVDEAGNAYVTGETHSTNFPTVNAFQTTKGGIPSISNAFVAKVAADGASLVYSSYLGGSGYSSIPHGDSGHGIAVDGAGNAYVVGETYSADFPTAHAFQPTKPSPFYYASAFVTKVSADGTNLVYSTYLGGSYVDSGSGIAVDGTGNAYVTGYAESTDFPTANAFQPTKSGFNSNAFVTKFSADGASLVYSTYLGGHGLYGDTGSGIAVDASGTYVTGYTDAADFPTTQYFGPPGGGVFITKFDLTGSALLYSTILGGGSNPAMAVDGAGDVYVTGRTLSPNFPTANAFQPTKGSPSNTYSAFVTKVAADGASLVYSSFLGGSGSDAGHGIAVDGAGNAYVTGSTASPDFPTVNAFQPVKGGTGAFRSPDGGTTWSAIDGAPPHALTNADIRSLAVDPARPATLYAGTNGGGVFQSVDAGANWNAINNGLTNAKIQVLIVDPANSATLYAGTDGGGVFQSTDSGTSWTDRNTGLTDLHVQTLMLDPTNSATVYAGTSDGGVFESTDGGASWTARNSGLTNHNVRSLAVDPATPTTVYAATGAGIFKSTDGGNSWKAANAGLPPMYHPSYALAIDPAVPSTLYVSIAYKSGSNTDYAVYKSTNSGGTWSDSSTGLGNPGLIQALLIDPVTPSTLYGGAGTGVYKSTNGGANWSQTGLNVLQVQALALDPTAPSTVYTGAFSPSTTNAFVAKIS